MKLWIARDKDGTLLIHFYKPIIDGLEWISLDYRIIDKNLFPEVTFGNSPQKIKLVSENISESIVNEFMNTLNFTYDKSEKCMVAKIHNADLISLKNIIESKL